MRLGVRVSTNGIRLAAVVAAAICTGTQFSRAQPANSPEPPIPFEDFGACPFEGCVYREWVANRPVAIRTARRAASPIRFRVKAGEKVTALTGVVVTLKAGRVQFREPQDLSSSDGTIHIVPGQILYLLTYEGEGYTKAWFNGRLYRDVDTATFFNGVCEIEPSRCTGKIIERQQTRWWVQIRNAAGNVGWTSEPDKFDGKDALGG